jgi:membrane protease YdiL (CAAX protease family)
MLRSPSAPREVHSLIVPFLAAGLFVPLFIFRGTGPLDFWGSMTLDVAFLCVLALSVDRTYVSLIHRDVKDGTLKKIGLGIASAVALYLIFLAGSWLAPHMIPNAGPGISRVYGFKSGVSPLRIVVLMILVIGPGEEIFWRGYLQRFWQGRFGNIAGWLLAAGLYTAVHAGSLNPMLVLAAAVCGLFWGYLFFKFRSPLMICVSHTLWDLLVFIILPFS